MFKFFSDQDVSGYTFILPSVSVGNVSQLAVDLLISTLQPLKWATVWHPVFLPTVGGDPYNLSSTAISTACELYIHKEKKIVIMQLRSPLIKKHKTSFLKSLVTWIKQQCFTQTIILASLSAYERFGLQLKSSPLRYVASQTIGEHNLATFKTLGWRELEKRSVFPAPAELSGNRETKEGEYYMPHGGFTKQFFNMCCAEMLPVAGLLKFCDEGCNTPDAQQLADYLNSWLIVTDEAKQWKMPPSWRLFFGNPPPIEIF